MALSRKKERSSHAPPNWAAIDRQILDGLDLRAEYRELGVEFVGAERSNGIIECYAQDRTDQRPSAYVHLINGRYGDSGSSDPTLVQTISFFEFVARYSKHGFEDYQAAREHFAAKVGIEIPKTPRGRSKSKRSYSPSAGHNSHQTSNQSSASGEDEGSNSSGLSAAQRLRFSEWNEVSLMWRETWTESIKPGTSDSALEYCCAKLAEFPVYQDFKTGELKLAKTSSTVIVLGVATEENLKSGDFTNPGARTLYPLYSPKLDLYQGKDKPPRVEKKVTIGPSRGSLMPIQSIQAITEAKQTGTEIFQVWKPAGETDTLALITAIPDELRSTHITLTNASGEGSDVLPCQVELLSNLPGNPIVNIIHDADKTGEIGAAKWLIALYLAGIPCRQVKLPYDVTESHGKDLRDWLIENHHNYQLLCELADAQPLYEPTAEELEEGQRVRKRLLEREAGAGGTEHDAGSTQAPSEEPPEPSEPAENELFTPTVTPLATSSITPAGNTNTTPPDPYAGREKPLWVGPVKDEKTQRTYKFAGYYYEVIQTYKQGVKVNDTQIVAKTPAEITEDLLYNLNNWPKRCGNQLFVDRSVLYPSANSQFQHKIQFFSDGNQLMAWIKSHFGTVDWRNASDCVNRQELFEHLLHHTDQFDSIEFLPQEPPTPTKYYAHNPIPAGIAEIPEDQGEAASQLGPLDTLVSMFRPGIPDVDDALIKCMILTLFWGSRKKPAFLISAVGKGTGAGKSTLVEIIASLVGTPQNRSGYLDFRTGSTIEVLLQEVFSEKNDGLRMVRIDNVKSKNFQWGDLEAIITTDTITGKKMYVGSASRDNDVMWVITVNGPSLGTDMAERVINIQILPPEKRSGDWETSVRSYIEHNRLSIITDCIQHLRRKPDPNNLLFAPTTRHSAWESKMFPNFSNPLEIQKVIAERLRDADTGQDEASCIEEKFHYWIEKMNYDPETDVLFVSNINAVAIVHDALKDRNSDYTTTLRKINAISTEGKIKNLVVNKSNKIGWHGFIWNGPAPEAEVTKYFNDNVAAAIKSEKNGR